MFEGIIYKKNISRIYEVRNKEKYFRKTIFFWENINVSFCLAKFYAKAMTWNN